MKSALTIVLFLAATFGYAQTGSLSGRVLSDKQPLEFATVALLKTSISAQTDSTGYFHLKNIPSGKYQLRISYLGYENYQTEVSVTDNVTLLPETELIPLNARIKEIVVTGTLKEVSKLESVTPVDVYSSAYFERNPVNNLFDGLQNVNGLFTDVDNGVSNTNDVQINGLEGNYTMVLIDGVPAMNGLAGMYALNTFPMSIVDKVEIVKGAASTLYGSDAIAGVINIKTLNPSNAPRFSMNAGLTSMLEANADISASFHTKKVSSLFALNAVSSNYRWDIDGDNFTDIPLVNRANFYNKWSLNRKDDRLAVLYLRYLFEDRFGGDKTLPSAWRGSNRYYSEAVTTHQWQAGIQYQFPFAEKVLLALDYSGHKQDGNYGYHYYHGLQHSGFAQLSWSKKIDRVNELLIGACYRAQYFTDNTPLTKEDYTGYNVLSHIGGVFMEDELTLATNHHLLLGARFDYSSRSGAVVSPRLNYKWNTTNEKNVLRIGAGTGYRTPNVLYEGFGALNGSRTIMLEEKLKPEIALNATANYTRVQELTGGILNIDAGLFYTYFFNYINPDYEQDPEAIVYSNSKGATATGFSLFADFTFNYPLKVGFGGTYVRTWELEEDDAGQLQRETPVHVPPFVATFYLSYNFPAPQLSLDWTGNLVTPMKLATVPGDFRPDHSPVYTIQNIQLTKKFKKGLSLYLGLKNFFNFIQKDPILRPFDPFNRFTNVDNPNDYHFDTTYGFTSTQGIKAFIGLKYVIP